MALTSQIGKARIGSAQIGSSSSGTILTPSGIVSRRAFGTATVTLDRGLYPAGIASRRAFGGSTVTLSSGVLYPSGISSRRAFGTAQIAQEQEINPSGIASIRAVGTPSVSFPALAQTVSPSGIASRRAFGSAGVLDGGVQYILFPGIPSRRAFGFPVLNPTGADPIKLYIAGVNTRLCVDTLSIDTRLSGGSTASFKTSWPQGTAGPIRPLIEQEVRITENWDIEFVGFIDTVTERIEDGTMSDPFWWFDVTCKDLTFILARRFVTKTYAAATEKSIVLDLVANFLTGENITTNNVLTTAEIPQEIKFTNDSVEACLNKLTQITGNVYFIDNHRDLNYYKPGDGPPSPWAITDISENVRAGSMSVTRSSVGFSNSTLLRTPSDLG